MMSLERLVGAVMCDQNEAWSDARYLSEKMMAELYDEKRKEGEGETDAGAHGRVASDRTKGNQHQPRACGRAGGGVGC